MLLRMQILDRFALFCAGLCMFATQVFGAEPAAIEGGREIFQREWTFEPPSMLDTEPMSPEQRQQVLASAPGDGLGPMHNATSCESCHPGGGGAGVERNVTLMTLDPRYSLITFFNQSFRNRNQSDNDLEATERAKQAIRELNELYPALISSGTLTMDVVVHEASTRPFFDPIRNGIAKHIPVGATKSWLDSKQRSEQAVAERPVLAGRHGEIDFYLSQRNSPPLFGLGLIDQIDDNKLRNLSRLQQRRKDGISGRFGTGKFGWRGQTPSLGSFVRGACAGELGLQVRGTAQAADIADETYRSEGLDLNDHQVGMLVSYVASIPSPTSQPRSRLSRTGERIFAQVGCNVCHVKSIQPAEGLYSDLLLHDMGELLQAPSPAARTSSSTMFLPSINLTSSTPAPILRRGGGSSVFGYYGSSHAPTPYPFARPEQPQFPRGRLPATFNNDNVWDVMQREWRTPPLWGVADSAPYLHDGRASTLDAAIRWHGGEAKDSRAAFLTLDDADQTQLIAFLRSLRAPETSLPNEPEPTILASEQLKRIAEVDVFGP